MAPDRPRLATVVPPLEAEIAPSLLLTDREAGGPSSAAELSCVLADGTGTSWLAGNPRSAIARCSHRPTMVAAGCRPARTWPSPAGPALRPGASAARSPRTSQRVRGAGGRALSHDAGPEPGRDEPGRPARPPRRARGVPSASGWRRGPTRRPRARSGAPALPRRAPHHRRTPGRGHRTRDQQSPGRDGELPEPRARARSSAATWSRRAGGWRAFARAWTARRWWCARSSPTPTRPRRRARPWTSTACSRNRRSSYGRGPSSRACASRARCGDAADRRGEPDHARTGSLEPHRQRLRGPARRGRGARELGGHGGHRPSPRWPIAARASRPRTASASSSPSSRPRTRPASASRSATRSSSSTADGWRRSRGPAEVPCSR